MVTKYIAEATISGLFPLTNRWKQLLKGSAYLSVHALGDMRLGFKPSLTPLSPGHFDGLSAGLNLDSL